MAVENGDKALLARLDIAIDKLTDVSADIKAILAVHEAKFENQEQLNQIYYDQIEKLHARIAESIMSVNAFKGIEIGMGFEQGKKLGSEVHDEIGWDDEK